MADIGGVVEKLVGLLAHLALVLLVEVEALGRVCLFRVAERFARSFEFGLILITESALVFVEHDILA